MNKPERLDIAKHIAADPQVTIDKLKESALVMLEYNFVIAADVMNIAAGTIERLRDAMEDTGYERHTHPEG